MKTKAEAVTVAQKRRKKLTKFDVIAIIILAFFGFITAYPMYFCVIASFSDPTKVMLGDVILLPKDITFDGYERMLQDETIWTGYMNTILYVGVGTFLSVLTTMMIAYPLSRKAFAGRKAVTVILLITMYFSGGMIPSYILVGNLGLRDTRFYMMIAGLISVYNVIVARSFLSMNIPQDLQEAAAMDGCSPIRFFIQMVLPLSKAIMAVLMLYYGVGKWNDYMTALIYLSDESKFPLALVLKGILITTTSGLSYDTEDPMLMMERMKMAESMKYGVMIVSTLPIMCLYPFLQKYFVKGVMIGSVKE
ncbi:MAG TPA: carbohydrate ABC transporter permease [Candidatus Fimimorpha excrementavium]|nr:carbohydrate ABC transporter permease [Candidatus Fimimorpha excrementavium]